MDTNGSGNGSGASMESSISTVSFDYVCPNINSKHSESLGRPTLEFVSEGFLLSIGIQGGAQPNVGMIFAVDLATTQAPSPFTDTFRTSGRPFFRSASAEAKRDREDVGPYHCPRRSNRSASHAPPANAIAVPTFSGSPAFVPRIPSRTVAALRSVRVINSLGSSWMENISFEKAHIDGAIAERAGQSQIPTTGQQGIRLFLPKHCGLSSQSSRGPFGSLFVLIAPSPVGDKLGWRPEC